MLRSYCTCGWNDSDDENDTNFNNHVFGDMYGNHRMCSFGEWNICKELFEKDNTINNLESQLESNCSEEVIILRERVLLLEKQVEILKEKLYANENGQLCKREASGRIDVGDSDEQSSHTRSRLSKRRNSEGS